MRQYKELNHSQEEVVRSLAGVEEELHRELDAALGYHMAVDHAAAAHRSLVVEVRHTLPAVGVDSLAEEHHTRLVAGADSRLAEGSRPVEDIVDAALEEARRKDLAEGMENGLGVGEGDRSRAEGSLYGIFISSCASRGGV